MKTSTDTSFQTVRTAQRTVTAEPQGSGTPGAAGETAAPGKIRMLFFPRETFPTFRVDVDVLFGRELVGRGHEIDFVMQPQSPDVLPGRRVWNGRTVWIGPTDTADGFVHRLRKHLLALWHDVACLRFARKPAYDALQIKDKYLIAALAAVIARRRGLRFFYWLSWPESESQLIRARDGSARYPALARIRGRTCAWLLYRWILPRSDHVFVQSQRMKEDVCAYGIDPRKVTPVPMGIDAGTLSAAERLPRRRSGGPVTIGYLGTLAAERRLTVLVDMLGELHRAGLDVRLLIVGDGNVPEERLALERRAAELGVRQRMEITGFLPRARAFERISEADIGVSPFHPTPILLSTSPTKLIEYMALGLPVVGNDHPEQRLVLRESRAGVCVPWGAKFFARGVRWLIERGAEERERIGERGRAWVRTNRTYVRIADGLERRYLELLSPRARTTL